MHHIDGYTEIEPGLVLPVFSPDKLITTKDRLRLVGFSRQETVLRYCRYSSRTVGLLGLKQTIELCENIFEKVALALGAVVTHHKVGVVEYTGSMSGSTLISGRKIKDDLLLVQEVDVVKPSINIASSIKQRRQCKITTQEQHLDKVVIGGFTCGGELNASQYVFGTTRSEREESLPAALHQVDLEYYIHPTARYLFENDIFDSW